MTLDELCAVCRDAVVDLRTAAFVHTEILRSPSFVRALASLGAIGALRRRENTQR